MPARRRAGRGPLDRFLEEAGRRQLEELVEQLKRKPPSNNTTTTTTSTGIRPPRWLGETSRQVLLALLVLGRATLDEISRVAGVDKRLAKHRLSYWKKRGLVGHDPPHWFISPRAAALLERLLNPVANSRKTVADQSQNGSKVVANSRKTVANCLEALEEEIERLGEAEKAVMNYLVGLARSRGQTWTYAQNLLQDLALDPQELRQALLYLQGRGLVYIWFDRRTGAARIGLRLSC